MKATILTPVLLLAASAAVAAPPAAQADRATEQEASAPAAESNAAADDAPEKERKICRTERATGSLTRRTRVCLTEAQWREINANTYRGINDMTRDRVGGGTTSSN